MARRRTWLIPIALVALLHVYIGARLLPDLPIGFGTGVIGGLILILSFVSMLVGFFARRSERGAWSDAIAATGLFSMGFFSSLFVFTLLRDVILLLAWLPLSAPTFDVVVSGSAVLVVALAVFATAVGFLNARRRARIVDVEVPLRGLPEALNGFTIAQISDIHVGPTIKRGYVDAIVDAVNALDADLIAVTGDLVDGSVRDLAPHTEPLSRLKARYGVYFVTGNHEYYSGERAWTAELTRLGLRVLENEHVVVSHRGSSLVLAGVTDFSAHHFDPARRSDPLRRWQVPQTMRLPRSCSHTSPARHPRQLPPGSTSSFPAIPTAGSFGPGTCSSASSSRLRLGCTV